MLQHHFTLSMACTDDTKIDLAMTEASNPAKSSDVIPSPQNAKEMPISKQVLDWLMLLAGKAKENFLLVCLASAVVLAFSDPIWGMRSSDVRTRDMRSIIAFVNTVIVFLISGITLKLEEMGSMFKQHLSSIIYGLVTINFITTLTAMVLVHIPFSQSQYATGLAIFSTVPTTLGVGVALTQQAKGDHMLSLFLTVASNMLGVVTVPFLLSLYLQTSTTGDIKLNPATLAIYLLETVLGPTIVGMLMRAYIPHLRSFTATYKLEIGMFSIANLMMIVWMSLSNARSLILRQAPEQIAIVLVVVAMQHIVFLLYNYLVLNWVFPYFGWILPRRQAASVIIMASQKSSPVALSIITVMAVSADERGLMTIPCILGQLSQIFIGTFICPRLAKWIQQEERTQTVEGSQEDDKQSGEEDGDGGQVNVEMVSTIDECGNNSNLVVQEDETHRV